MALPMLILLHGSGDGWPWLDEVLLFGGLAVLVIFLMFLPRVTAMLRKRGSRQDEQNDENSGVD